MTTEIGPRQAQDGEPACRHHWRIDPPAGPTSHGRCTACGAEREFFNYGGPMRSLSTEETRRIAEAKREEAALRDLIYRLGSDSAIGFDSYRHNFQGD